MNKENALAVFENFRIRRIYDEKSETWFFSVVDIIAALIGQPDYQAVRNYWKVLKNRLKKEGNESVTKCNRLKMTDYWKEHDINEEDEHAMPTNIIHQERNRR